MSRKPKPAKGQFSGDRPHHVLPWLAAVSILYITALGGTSFWMDRQAMRAIERQELDRVRVRARTLASLVEREFAKAKTVLLSVEERNMFRQSWQNRDGKELQQHLEDIRRLEPGFMFASVYEPDGTLRAIEPPDPIVGKNYAHRDWYKGVTTQKAPYVSEIYETDAAPNPPVVAVAIPIRDERDVTIGILMAPYTTSVLEKKLRALENGSGNALYVADQNGVLVASTEEAEAGERMVPEALVARAWAREEGSTRADWRDGEVFAGYAPVHELGWVLVSARRAEDALALARQLRGWGVAAGGFLSLIYLVTMGMALKLVREQSTLLDANKKLAESLRAARDDLELRVRERTGELARANEELASGEERFRAFMDNSPAVAFMKDKDGRMLYVNSRFEQTFQAPRETWLGKSDFELWPAEVAEQLRAHDQQVLISGRPMETTESVPVPGVGTRQWLVLKFPITDAKGKKFLGGIGLDVTERQVLEKQLQQAQKMEAVGHLAGGVAHDFNNLLGVIIGYCEILATAGGLEEKDRERVAEIKKAGDRAATLTRQLLAFSRQQVIEPRVLDLNALLADMSKLLRRLIGEDIELVTRLSSGLGRVKADPGQMEQVVMNLAINARDAMPRGGKLILETGNVALDENYARTHITVQPGKFVLLAVTDTGVGMDEEIQAHIFEPFFTTKGEGRGTGLGLATVYGIVKQSGGNIWVYSERGRGTTFKIYLPLVAEPDVQATKEAAAEIPRGRETILVVEDADPMRKLTCEFLAGMGYIVLEASDGVDALEKAGQYSASIDLLLTDVVMPRMSGRELAVEMTARQPGLKVLYMSGYTDDAVVRHGVLDASMAFIQKPFALHALAARIREVLDSPA